MLRNSKESIFLCIESINFSWYTHSCTTVECTAPFLFSMSLLILIDIIINSSHHIFSRLKILLNCSSHRSHSVCLFILAIFSNSATFFWHRLSENRTAQRIYIVTVVTKKQKISPEDDKEKWLLLDDITHCSLVFMQWWNS